MFWVAQGAECAVIERADPGQPCSASRLCQGQSYCVQNVCACISNYVLEGNQCLPPRTGKLMFLKLNKFHYFINKILPNFKVYI